MLQAVKSWVNRHPTLQHAYAHMRAVAQRGRKPHGDIPPLPERIIVEPTNGCNLGCAYCGNKDMIRPWTYMPLDVYERLLDEMVEHDIRRMTLHTIGEPTLHPRIAEMVRMATARGRVVTMSTNGTLMKEELARDLVRAAPAILNFSADAGDAETLAKSRDGLSLDTLLAGMRHVRRFRDLEGPYGDTPWGRVRLPTITVTCVLTPWFTREVERRFFETFDELVDDYMFHYPNNHSDYVHDTPHYKPGRFLSRKVLDKLYKRIRMPCPYPWDSLYLLSDGTVSVCRFDFDARVEVGRYPAQSIPELWKGQKMMSLRRAHMSFEFADWSTCENCTGTFYENRHSHHVMTRKLMHRNGVKPSRDSWLPAQPKPIAIER